MNRAMGFGLATGGVLAGLTAVPSPASAHPTQLQSPQGIVEVFEDVDNYPGLYEHERVLVTDYEDDGILVGAQIKESSNYEDRIVNLTPGDEDGIDYRTPSMNGFYVHAYRKCQFTPATGVFGCTDWVVP